MNYIALDQSLNITGWAIFSNEKLITCGTFTIKPSKPIEQRLHEIHSNLNELKAQVGGEIEHLFLEDIQYQNNKETYKKLAYVQSQIFTWCYWNDIKFTVLPPSHWRKIITDNYGIKFGRTREEQKKACYNFILNKWHMSKENTTEDMCDAVALGMAGIDEYRKTRSDW